MFSDQTIYNAHSGQEFLQYLLNAKSHGEKLGAAKFIVVDLTGLGIEPELLFRRSAKVMD